MEMRKLKMTEGVSAPSAYTIAWFPSREPVAEEISHLSRTQEWIIFLK
ncbi:hypothetical protein [Siminovitchia fortis]|nr:hypothetical protein [Siminovitchia fortis]WHY81830.1 hypothetical protein QNH23_18520 [Siminovitchia fortis]